MKTLRPYQRQAIDAVYDYFRHGGGGNPLISIATGGGKSFIIANIIEEARGDILVLSHTKEIIEQNAAELGDIPHGIYSASLGKKETEGKAVFGTIQSVARKPELFSRFKTIIVDECHRISDKEDTQYQQLFSTLKPERIIGVTATPFRMGTGKLTDGNLFDKVVFEADIKYLTQRGYLAPLVTKVSKDQPNLSGLHLRGGEYILSELGDLFEDNALVKSTVTNMIRMAKDRKKWLVFCASIKHAEMVAAELNNQGIASSAVHSKSTDRDSILDAFSNGEIRALCNVDILTTGYNEPAIDAVMLLRPTKSLGLYIQQVGRGSRLFPGKDNCLILDFAGNIKEHGPIDMPVIRVGKKGDQPKYTHKECPECETAIPINAKECPECGYEFLAEERAPKHSDMPDTEAPLFKEPPRWIEVEAMVCERHKGKKGIDSMKVTYYGGYRDFSEWICVNHQGFAKEKADAWIASRRLDKPGNCQIDCFQCKHTSGYVKENLVYCNECDSLIGSAAKPKDNVEKALRHNYRQPSHILVEKDGKYDRIVSYRWEMEKEVPLGELLKDEIIF